MSTGSVRALHRVSVRTSILTAVLTAVAVAVGVGVLSLVQMDDISGDTDALYRRSYQPVVDLGVVREQVWKARWATTKAAVATDAASKEKYLKQYEEISKTLDAAIASYRSRDVSPQQRAGMDSFAATWKEWQTLREQSDALHAAGKLQEWQDFTNNKINPTVTKALDSLDALSAGAASEASSRLAASRRTADRARLVVGVVLLAGVCFALVLALAASESIVRPLRRVRDVLDAVAQGDLTQDAEIEARNELGHMAAALRQAVGRMRSTVATMTASSAALATRAAQLDRSSQDLERVAEETADQVRGISGAAGGVSENVHSVAAGAEEMGVSIREISGSAQEAVRVAGDAVSAARGAEEIMLRLGASSAEIGNVIKVITSIAEQTNLLALNATIEAARAGAAGRGFAVVADEVKQLAQETARATEDVSRRVEAIQADTRSAMKSIEGVSSVIGQINAFQTTIASAVEEQSVTTGGMAGSMSSAAADAGTITAGIEAVSGAASGTLESVVEARAAAADLSAMSEELRRTVTAFRV